MSFELPNLERGVVYHLLGRSGTGKSSLLSCLAGLLPFEGSLAVFGNTYRCAQNETGNVELAQLSSVLLQRHVVDPDITVASHAMFVASETVFNELISEFDLEPMIMKKASEMSTGQQQRLGLAVVFAQQQPLAILDEPTAHQDIQYTTLIGKRITEYVRAGNTVVFSSHDAELLDALQCPIHTLDPATQLI